MGRQVDQTSCLVTAPGAGPRAPLATDERAALLEFLRDFSSAAPTTHTEQPVAGLNETAAWPLAPEDDPSFDPAGAAASRAFLSRFAAAASAPQATSLLTPLSDQYWEPDLTRTASGQAAPSSTKDQVRPATAPHVGPPPGIGPALNGLVAGSPGASASHDPFFSLAARQASGPIARGAPPTRGAPGPGPGTTAPLPGRVATLPAQRSPEYASPTSYASPASPASPTSYASTAGVTSSSSTENTANAVASLPAQSDVPPSPQPARPESGAHRRRLWRRAPMVVGSVVLLFAVVGVGVLAMGSRGTAGADQTVHLAGPLARASGGVAGPATVNGSLRSLVFTAPNVAGQQAAAGLCQDFAPPGASAATLAYIAATNAVVPQWTAISRALGKNGGQARPQDFLSEMKADSRLLDRLDEISFPGHTAALAANFETSLRRYVLQLGQIVQHGATQPATATLNRLYSQRVASSSLLRTALGLSPEYACQWLRPGTSLG